MPASDFKMELGIDGNGVMLTRFCGTFDVAAWLTQRDAARERDYADVDLAHRPVVCDIRDCRFPESDWTTQFRTYYAAVEERHQGPFRRALVIGRDLGTEIAVQFFVELAKISGRQGIETRAFHSFEEAYAWATEDWLTAKRSAAG